MSLPLSLLSYLTDLGLEIPDRLTLAFTTRLQQRHVERYTFNSIAALLREDISLDIDDISQKLVTRGFGGYCFEHNKLTFELLNALGGDVKLMLARVLNNQDINAPRTHRVSLLTLDNHSYLIDTGFGSNGPIAPLLLKTDIEQKAGIDTYRLIQKAPQEYDLQIRQADGYFTLYRFDLAEYSDADCTLGHFYSHKHPQAAFVNNLVVSIKTAEQTTLLKNQNFTIKNASGEHTQAVTTAAHLADLFASVFSISLAPEISAHLFERVIAPRLSEHSL